MLFESKYWKRSFVKFVNRTRFPNFDKSLQFLTCWMTYIETAPNSSSQTLTKKYLLFARKIFAKSELMSAAVQNIVVELRSCRQIQRLAYWMNLPSICSANAPERIKKLSCSTLRHSSKTRNFHRSIQISLVSAL